MLEGRLGEREEVEEGLEGLTQLILGKADAGRTVCGPEENDGGKNIKNGK